MPAPLAPDFRPRYHELHRVGRPGAWRSVIGGLLLLLLVFAISPILLGGLFFGGLLLAGRSIDSLRAELEVTFLMMQVGAEVDWNPAPDRVLPAGAKVVVVTTMEALTELEVLNQERSRFSGLLRDPA